MGRELPGGAGSSDGLNNFLEHHGVKGMKWGVRKSDNGPTAVAVTARAGKRVKTSGGTGHAPSADAIKAAISKQTAKKSSTDALSTPELRALVERLNLERQYSTLKPQSPKSAAQLFVRKTVIGIGQEQVTRVGREAAAKQVTRLLKKS